ncbi:MAG: phage major capsid protein [Ruminococcus sp.]|nr:phage major capsid protein [Ruminococcus sp.]
MADYKNITLEKGMYGVKGKTFSQVLEELDPTENYRGTPLGKIDAFSRQLKRFDIKVSGKGSDKIEKFFSTTASAALFPEYVSRAVNQGIEAEDVLPDIVATTTMIEGLDYRSITSTPTDDEKSLKVVAEGASIPQTYIRTQDSLVKLNKHGRMLVSSYEAIRYQRIDLFSVTLRQIGAYIARAQLKDAVDVLINGDGNSNPADKFSVKTSGSVTYSDLISLWAKLSPYSLNAILAPTEGMQKLLAMDEMKDASAGLNFHGTGSLVTPLGAKLVHIPGIDIDSYIGLDKTCALEMVKSGEVQTEYDKLIDRQLERASITSIAGFAKIFNAASAVMQY